MKSGIRPDGTGYIKKRPDYPSGYPLGRISGESQWKNHTPLYIHRYVPRTPHVHAHRPVFAAAAANPVAGAGAMLAALVYRRMGPGPPSAAAAFLLPAPLFAAALPLRAGGAVLHKLVLFLYRNIPVRYEALTKWFGAGWLVLVRSLMLVTKKETP
jgi:hypothetical protein